MTPALALALPLIKKYEGCRLTPYLDSTGRATIGWGAITWNGYPVSMATLPITQEQADAALEATAADVETRVREFVHVALADHECAALVSLSYNEGTGRIASSTLVRLLNAGDRVNASRQFLAWVYAGGRILEGLVARRTAERALFDGVAKSAIPPSQLDSNAPTSAAGTGDSATEQLNDAELSKIGNES